MCYNTVMSFSLEKYKKLRQEVEERYRQIGSIYCPALKADIFFSAVGFHHLRYDNAGSERSKTSQFNKFMFFDDAADAIEISTTIQEYRRSICPLGNPDKSGFRKTTTVEWFAFWQVVSFSKGIRIKSIIRRIGGDGHQFHFWSVMPYWTLSNGQRIIGSKDIENM